jgi:hypothetical protein
MSATLPRAAAAVLALGILGPLTAAPAEAAAPAARDRVLVRLGDSGVRMTDSLRPGLHRFVVAAGDGQDDLQLIRPRAGYTVEEYARDLERAGSGSDRAVRSATRRMDANLRLRGGVVVDDGQRAVFWQTVARGRLWVVSHDRPRDVHQVKVTGRRARSAAPAPSATLTVTDGAVHVSATTLRPKGVFRFRNDGSVPHMVGLAKLVDGGTAEDVLAYVEAVLGDDSTVDPTTLASPFDDEVFGAPTAALSPGGRMLMRYALPPGDYVAVCVAADREAVRLHLQDGEVTGVRLG